MSVFTLVCANFRIEFNLPAEAGESLAQDLERLDTGDEDQTMDPLTLATPTAVAVGVDTIDQSRYISASFPPTYPID